MNEMPIQQYYVLPYDRWEGYEAERQQILLRAPENVKNVIFLTTDVHATLVNDARFQTLESGGPENSGIFDVIVGPVATANFGLEIDQSDRPARQRRARGRRVLHAAAARRRRDAVLVLDQFSYGQVRVTRNQLTVTPKDIERQAADNRQRASRAAWSSTTSAEREAADRSRRGARRAARRRPAGGGRPLGAAGLLRRDVRQRHREGRRRGPGRAVGPDGVVRGGDGADGRSTGARPSPGGRGTAFNFERDRRGWCAARRCGTSRRPPGGLLRAALGARVPATASPRRPRTARTT